MDNSKYEEVLLNLKILSMIPRNGKIKRSGNGNSNGNITLERDDILVPLKRFIYNDGRKKSVTDINCILDETFTLLKYLSNMESTKENINKSTVICKELLNSKKGLHNLKDTYKDDIKICASIELVLDKINHQLSETSETLRDPVLPPFL